MGYTTQTHLVQPLQSFISIHSLYLLFIFEVNHRDRYRGGEHHSNTHHFNYQVVKKKVEFCDHVDEMASSKIYTVGALVF